MVDAQLYKDVYSFWLANATALHAATGANATFVLQTIPRNLVEQGLARGGNPLGLPRETHQCALTYDATSRRRKQCFS